MGEEVGTSRGGMRRREASQGEGTLMEVEKKDGDIDEGVGRRKEVSWWRGKR